MAGKKNIKNSSVSGNNKIVEAAKRRGYTYVSSNFHKIGEVDFGYPTMYELQKLNPQAQSAKDLIVKMIGRKGVLFTKDDVAIKDEKREKIIKKLFRDPTTNSWKTFKDKYYTNAFCSGMVNCFYANMGDGTKRIQILDSRYVVKELDGYGNLKKITYNNNDLPINKYYGQIYKYDPDKPGYGMSTYHSVVYDALSDRDSSKRNYMFFKNGAMPNVILTMDDDIENEDEINAAIDQFEQKYKGTNNAHGVLALGGVKEIRTLDISNKDLELLELKKFSIKIFGMLFGFDPRFLAFRDGENGSHSEYAKLAIQSDKSMQSYADNLEEFMLGVISDMYPDFPYDGIELVNDTFLDEETKIKIYKEEIQNAISTPAEIIKKLGKPTDKLGDDMKKYFMNIQYNTVSNLLKESESRTELNIKKSKE